MAVAALALTPVHAQTALPPAPAPAPEAEAETELPREGLGLIEEGARMFFRGIIAEMEPMLEDLRGRAEDIEPAVRSFAREMGPAMMDMLSRIDDIRHYDAPELLDNGDIVIRRSPDAPPYVPRAPAVEDAPQGEVEL